MVKPQIYLIYFAQNIFCPIKKEIITAEYYYAFHILLWTSKEKDNLLNDIIVIFIVSLI